MKTLHLAIPEKFIPPLVDMIEENFGLDENHFIIKGNNSKHPIRRRMGVVFYSDFKFFISRALYIVEKMNSSERIVLHGLFNMTIVRLLFLQPWLLKKCYWVIWGGDLYQNYEGKSLRKRLLQYKIKKFVISRMGHLVTYLPEDIAYARKAFGAQGQYHECLCYMSNVFSEKISGQGVGSGIISQGGVTILLGNSSSRSNHHEDIISRLRGAINENDSVVFPLSYGDKKNAQFVAGLAQNTFGNQAKIITDFMQYDEYIQLICSVDVAVFNHSRQEAMGNSIQLLGMGKKLYLRVETPQWHFFQSKNLAVFDNQEISLEPLSDAVRRKNIEMVNAYFSTENLVNQWAGILRG